MNQLLVRHLSLVVALAITSCGGEPGTGVPESPVDHCPGGSAPALAECDYDGLRADCGGDGSSRWIGCSDSGCRFFEGGCVAQGFDAYACDLADPCCVGSALAGPSSVAGNLGYMFLRSFGHPAEDLEAAYVLDLVASASSLGADVGFTCPESPSFHGYACGTGSPVVADSSLLFPATDVTRAVAASNGFGVEGFVVDIRADDGGIPTARVCAYDTTDYAVLSCSATPDNLQPLRCATSGVVTWDGIGPGHADVIIANQTWSIDF